MFQTTNQIDVYIYRYIIQHIFLNFILNLHYLICAHLVSPKLWKSQSQCAMKNALTKMCVWRVFTSQDWPSISGFRLAWSGVAWRAPPSSINIFSAFRAFIDLFWFFVHGLVCSGEERLDELWVVNCLHKKEHVHERDHKGWSYAKNARLVNWCQFWIIIQNWSHIWWWSTKSTNMMSKWLWTSELFDTTRPHSPTFAARGAWRRSQCCPGAPLPSLSKAAKTSCALSSFASTSNLKNGQFGVEVSEIPGNTLKSSILLAYKKNLF